MLSNKISNAFISKPAQQTSSFKKDENNYMAAAQKNNLENNKQDIGDVLNTVVDPNYVDPEKKRVGVGNPNLDKDAFFKLMLAQMKNQDPTNPMQSHETAAQLAQFSSLEQLQNVNTNINQLAKAQEPATKFQVLNLIGKEINSDSSIINHMNGDTNHDIKFNLLADAKEVDVLVRDMEGNTMKEFKVNNLKKGVNKINWNATNTTGEKVLEGRYDVVIKAKDSYNKGVGAETKVAGRITGVNYTSSGPMILVGNQTITLAEIQKIVDPNINSDVTNSTNVAQGNGTEVQKKEKLALNGNTSSGQNGNTNTNSSNEPKMMKGNIKNVPMAQGLLNTLNKETK